MGLLSAGLNITCTEAVLDPKTGEVDHLLATVDLEKAEARDTAAHAAAVDAEGKAAAAVLEATAKTEAKEAVCYTTKEAKEAADAAAAAAQELSEGLSPLHRLAQRGLPRQRA